MGYIKLDRAIENWRYKTKPNYVALWVELLLRANHSAKKWNDIVIERGQFVTSYESLQKGTGLSLQQIRTIFNKLKEEEITIKTTNKYSLITIVNYDKYQGEITTTNKQTNNQEDEILTNNQQTTNKQLTTNKNNKNKKNEKNNKYIYRGSEKLIDALLGFEEMRKLIKSPMTDKARDRLVKRLNSITTDENEQIEILENSIVNCWKDVYPLKKKSEDEERKIKYEQPWMN